MATHSSTLAWEIPWMEKPGGLQPMGPRELYMTEQVSMHTCIRMHTYTHAPQEEPGTSNKY